MKIIQKVWTERLSRLVIEILVEKLVISMYRVICLKLAIPFIYRIEIYCTITLRGNISNERQG